MRNVDRIYVLDRGSVLEDGRHEELMARRGKYWEMVEMQAM